MRPSLFFLTLICTVALAESGSLDPTFGSGGVAVTSLVSGNDFARGMAIQEDGKVIAVGEAAVGSKRNFAVARYRADGTLDPSFNGTGTLTLPLGIRSDYAFAAVVQNDRKIVVAGWSQADVSGSRIALVRLRSNGTRDSSFGNQGVVLTGRPGWWMGAYAATRQHGGKILVAAQGVNLAANEYFWMAVRYNSDGSLDSSFGNGGISETPVKYGFPHAITIAENGGILVGGHYFVDSAGEYRMGVIRLHSNGAQDLTFGTQGVSTLPVSLSIANRILTGRDGRFYAAGGGRFGSDDRFLLARFKSNGELDPSFGVNGVSTLSIGGVQAQAFGAVAYRHGITLAGIARVGGESHFAFARFHLDGTVDTDFGEEGVTTVPAGSDAESGGRGLVYDPYRHRLVSAGGSSSGGPLDFALVGVRR